MRVPSVLLLLAAVCFAQPQVPAGGITGVVRTVDESPVADAKLTLLNRQTKTPLTATANQAGRFEFAPPNPGDYDLSVAAEGFKPYIRYAIHAGGGPFKLDVMLRAENEGPQQISALESAVAAQPDDVASCLKLGWAYFDAGSLEKARDRFKKVLELKPGFVPAQKAMAQLSVRIGDPKAGLVFAQEALELKPDDRGARLFESAAYIRTGRFDIARDLLTGILKDYPYDVETLLEMGVLNLLQKQYSESEDAFRRAYALDPSNMRGLMGVAEGYFQLQEFDKAVQTVAAEVSKDPRRGDLRKELATLEYRTQRYDKAIADFEAVLDQYKDSPADQADLHNRLAISYGQTDKFDRAIEHARQAVQLVPDNAIYLNSLADLYNRAGRRQEAIAAYKTVLKSDPNNAITMNNLAYLIVNSGGDLDEALSIAQKARQNMPDLAEIRDTIGWIYLKKDLVDSASRMFADLVEKYPANSAYHYHYAVALERQGNRAAALQQLDLALKNNPSKEDEPLIKELKRKLS
ncbi:MAG TPA: tetratricopeptide repeat protein [Bryobacteraceae bacterium]|jgi:tetratricopeptide (TPR) repeat protein